MTTKYSNGFVAIHWIHAILITLMLVAGSLSLPELPKEAIGLENFRGHMIMGAIVLLLAIARVMTLKREPELESLKMSSARESMVSWNHRLIYFMIFITAISGAATAKSANLGQVVIFGNEPSVYTGGSAIVSTISSVHTASATILALLVAMHIVGVLSYKFKTKKPILGRMWF